jgi:hypothetical protein
VDAHGTILRGFIGLTAAAPVATLDARPRENGDAATNITIEFEASFVDLLLNGITSGIYAPGNVIVSGTVVKYE